MIETAPHPAARSEFLSRLHDGELSPAEAAAFESHRRQCAECRASVAEFESALSAYRAAREAPVASDLSARILRKIRATSPSRRPFGVMFGIDVRWAGALAAALLVVIIGAPVFSRWPGAEPKVAPVSSAPIPAHVLDAGDERAARAPEAPRPAEIRGAPKSRAETAGPVSHDLAKREEALIAAAPPADANENAASERHGQEVSAPVAGLSEAPAARADAAKEAPASLSARRRSASAPAGGEAGIESSAQPRATAARLRVRAIDGQGQAPEVISAPADDRLASLKGQEFVLVVESGGRVRAVVKREPEQRLGKDKAAAVEGAPAASGHADSILRELVFHPGDRARRLMVEVR